MKNFRISLSVALGLVILYLILNRSKSPSPAHPDCELLHPAQHVADIVSRRPWVHHDNPQHSATVEHSGTDVAKAAFIELFLDCPMPAI